MSQFQYVILGGGVVAGYAAQEFVEQGVEPGELCIVSEDSALPYDRPPLSKGFLAGKKSGDEILINSPQFYEQHGITVLLDTPITRIELEDRRLQTKNGDLIHFDKLLLATGSRVRRLNIPGADLEGVHYLRYKDDAERISEAARHAKQVVIVGGGYIGMEVGATLASRGLQVTLVFPETRLMERFFTPEISAFFHQVYTERGVTLCAGETVVAFKGEQRVQEVRLDSGEHLKADFVVAGIGVTPAVELFEGTGLHLDNGVIVNKYLETNRAGVFAAGDVAKYYDVLTQQHRRIEHWDNAVQQGKHAAKVMSGRRQEYMALRYFFSDIFDLSYEFWGETDGAQQIVTRGSLDDGRFSVWWLADDRVSGVFIMDRPDEERTLGPQWIQQRRRVSSEHLADETQPLAEMSRSAL